MKKLLVLGNYSEAEYHPLTKVDNELADILSEYELTLTNESKDLLKLNEYDGFISYWDDWHKPIGEEESKALCEYVKDGNGCLIIHNGISLQLREELKVLAGGMFVRHPEQEVIEFLPIINDVTKDCGSFKLKEEPYQYELVNDDKEIILEYVYREKKYPAGWKKNYGKGRVIYLMPGHTPEKFKEEEYRKLIKKSMNWCMGE